MADQERQSIEMKKVLVTDYSEFKELGINTLRKDVGESVVIVFTRTAVDLNIAETSNYIWVSLRLQKLNTCRKSLRTLLEAS